MKIYKARGKKVCRGGGRGPCTVLPHHGHAFIGLATRKESREQTARTAMESVSLHAAWQGEGGDCFIP